jgi:hypothetical protein
MRTKAVWKFTPICFHLFLIVVSSLVLISDQVSAQPTAACEALPTLEEKTAQQLRLVSREVVIECLTDEVAVIAFEEINSKFGWTAIDAFAKSNYTFNDIVPSGMGTEGNPTRFFVVMTKD